MVQYWYRFNWRLPFKMKRSKYTSTYSTLLNEAWFSKIFSRLILNTYSRTYHTVGIRINFQSTHSTTQHVCAVLCCAVHLFRTSLILRYEVKYLLYAHHLRDAAVKGQTIPRQQRSAVSNSAVSQDFFFICRLACCNSESVLTMYNWLPTALCSWEVQT